MSLPSRESQRREVGKAEGRHSREGKENELKGSWKGKQERKSDQIHIFQSCHSHRKKSDEIHTLQSCYPLHERVGREGKGKTGRSLRNGKEGKE